MLNGVSTNSFDGVINYMLKTVPKTKPKPTYRNPEFTIEHITNGYNRFAYLGGKIDATSFPKIKKIPISEDTLCSNCKKEKCYPYSTCRNCREVRTVKIGLKRLVSTGDLKKITNGRGIKGGASYKITALGKARHKKIQQSKIYKRKYPKISRNDPCYCGSGRKYKKCCL